MQQEGNTLLHVAAKHGSMDVVVKLYLAGADASKLNQVSLVTL
jgi:ankyrin repeat protein